MDRNPTAPPPASAPTEAPGSSGGWLVLLGLGLGAFGAALAVLPAHLGGWEAVRGPLIKHGGTPLGLLLTGAVITALGLVARQVRRGARGQQQALESLASTQPVLEDVHSELAQVRGVLQELRVGFVYLRDAQKTIEQRLVVDLDPSSRDGLQAAVFQMAGSLDQATARIEERMAMQDMETRRSLQAFHDALQTTCARVDELHARVSTVAEATLILSQGRVAAPAHEGSLGVLDLLDDPALPPAPASPAAATAPAPARRSLAVTPSTPAPPGPPAPLPMPVFADPATASKVASLQQLLGDEQVRQALADMQRAVTP
jgi:hypothetical protein